VLSHRSLKRHHHCSRRRSQFLTTTSYLNGCNRTKWLDASLVYSVPTVNWLTPNLNRLSCTYSSARKFSLLLKVGRQTAAVRLDTGRGNILRHGYRLLATVYSSTDTGRVVSTPIGLWCSSPETGTLTISFGRVLFEQWPFTRRYFSLVEHEYP